MTEPYLIITSDAHAGLPTEQYRTYLEAKYHPAFDDWLSEREAHLAEMTNLGVRNSAFADAWYAEHGEALNAGWDALKRDQELDSDGICGEVVFPDANAVESRTSVPFGVGLGLAGDFDPDLGMAGARAHNRWLAELCQHSPERRKGVALIPITAELDVVLAEIRRCKDEGLGAVMIPAMWVNQRPYHDRHYDPVWALCEELQLPICTHSGSTPREEFGDHLGIYVTEVTWWPARPMWFLLWSGVFERFPGLRFGVTEGGCWWLPPLLWFWDRLYMGQKGAEKLGAKPFGDNVQMLPSEYVDRNVFIGASNTKRREIGQRYEIGIDNILWGSDFPHPEGTWPSTREWLKKTFHDVPVEETRRMVGLAAADVFGFDLDALRPLAAKIGPMPEDFGQTDDAAAVARWAPVKEVGRHWLTGHDFSLIG